MTPAQRSVALNVWNSLNRGSEPPEFFGRAISTPFGKGFYIDWPSAKEIYYMSLRTGEVETISFSSYAEAQKFFNKFVDTGA